MRTPVTDGISARLFWSDPADDCVRIVRSVGTDKRHDSTHAPVPNPGGFESLPLGSTRRSAVAIFSAANCIGMALAH